MIRPPALLDSAASGEEPTNLPLGLITCLGLLDVANVDLVARVDLNHQPRAMSATIHGM